MEMARYGQTFKDRAVARLLPPQSAALEVVVQEIGIGIGTGTLQLWHDDAQSRLDGVITTAAMDEVGKSAWCRQHGVYPAELAKWQMSATAALAEPEEARASPQSTRHDKKRIKELERDLLRKDRALAEMEALLVLSKKSCADLQ